jgi:DNA polymerase III subunit epsilon
MREIVLDTETTGLSPGEGHRVVEIGCIELINHLPSGRSFHCYINPERSMPSAAFEVHGLSDDFLADQPSFAEIATDFLAFIAETPLIIHNAAFDMGFLNAELARIERPPLAADRAIDTVTMARRRFPGAPANLDALCRRFAIDNSARDKHGALLDAELLAEVYLELIGGRQPRLTLVTAAAGPTATGRPQRPHRAARPHAPGADELAAHEAFIAGLKNPLWER